MTLPDTCNSPHPSDDAFCPRCGWPNAVIHSVVSRHRTSRGTILYTRCACGALQVRRTPGADPARLIAQASG